MKRTRDARLMAVPKCTVLSAAIGTMPATSLAVPVNAQEFEEIIETTTKRSESMQDVPLAITAFSGKFAEFANLDDVKDLISFTPGITGNSQDSFIDAVSVRGILPAHFFGPRRLRTVGIRVGYDWE